MTIEASDLVEDIRKGVERSWLTNFQMSDSPYELIEPEYLTTVCVCQTLASSLNGLYRIRAEEKTRSIWKARALISWLSATSWQSLRESYIRKGNVDISISERRGNLNMPFAVIENKNFLRLTRDRKLYRNSRNEIHKDLNRNLEFLLGKNSQGAVEFTAFTFYVQDSESVTKCDGKKFRDEVKTQVQNLVREKTNSHGHLHTYAEVESCSDSLYPTFEDAIEPDENGCPAYVAYNPHHIAYGLILIFISGSIVVYNKGFNRPPANPGAAKPGEFSGGAG